MTPAQLADFLRAVAPGNILEPFLLEAADALDEQVDTLTKIREHDQEQAHLLYWTRVELEAYLSSIGLPAVPAASTGNEHLDWLTDHL